jgi:DNA primase
MRNQEQIRELKQISIIGYLAKKGIKPVSQSSGWLMYHSPLREGDNKPSFGVHCNKNIYNDLASGDKGNVIELVMRLELIGFHKACEILERLDCLKEKESFFSPSNSQTLSNQTNTIKSIKPLQHQALIKYCQSRGISFSVAYQYLKEIEYTTKNDKKYFGVGFPNDSGGYAVRSQLQGGKINIGSQYFTSIIVSDSQSVMVFEGFFDFLSAVEYYGRKPSMTAIILNSTNNLNKALSTISQYTKIYAYLDNDDSGRKALEKLKQIDKTVIDQSKIYQGYNDFNEFLIVGTKPP